MPTIPPLSCAIIGDQTIFLDCAADRYFAMPEEHNHLFLRFARGLALDCTDRSVLRECLGVPVDHSMLDRIFARRLDLPNQALACEHANGLSFKDRTRAVANTITARAILRSRGLLRALESVASIDSAGSTPAVSIETICAVHNRLSYLVSSTDACLTRSIALARHARRSGHSVSLVIGVKLHPFAAHCWVQSGSYVLNDELDRVAAFHPILVIP